MPVTLCVRDCVCVCVCLSLSHLAKQFLIPRQGFPLVFLGHACGRWRINPFGRRRAKAKGLEPGAVGGALLALAGPFRHLVPHLLEHGGKRWPQHWAQEAREARFLGLPNPPHPVAPVAPRVLRLVGPLRVGAHGRGTRISFHRHVRACFSKNGRFAPRAVLPTPGHLTAVWFPLFCRFLLSVSCRRSLLFFFPPLHCTSYEYPY